MVKIGKFNEVLTLTDKAGSTLPVILFADSSQGVCTCSIAANIPPNCKAIYLYLSRASGTGTLSLYPNSKTMAMVNQTGAVIILPITNQEVKYKCSAAEVWTLYMVAYLIEGERKT